jgi:hypothetical protein
MLSLDYIQTKTNRKVTMPIWARFAIFTAGTAVIIVSVMTEVTLESVEAADHVRAFLGLWLGPVSVFGAVAGLWVRPARPA